MRLERLRPCKDCASSGIYDVMPLQDETAIAEERALLDTAADDTEFDDRVDLQQAIYSSQ